MNESYCNNFNYRDYEYATTIMGSSKLTNANNERVCHDIVAKINGSQEMYDHFVSEAGHRREIITRVSYLCGELK
jgi:hypothetical protein